ncbi:MAG: SAM-dependent chlorinase/fluorinase [Flavobacteriales bacterium]|nr:SAM-dependent chlorinase/fluorinase [Flavobacteriales bacterium]
MNIVTLTTDMGLKDHYVAVVKGALYSQVPDVRIVDISHQITPFDNAQTAFVLRHAYPEFPRGTVHLIGVNPEASGTTPHLVVRHDGHYFIGADNGIFPLLFDGKPQEAFELTMKLENDHATFPLKNVFVRAAAFLLKGGTPEVIGRKTVSIREMLGIRPAADNLSIRGAVIYVDGYGNVVTNIMRPQFHDLVKGQPFRITFGGRPANDIRHISEQYNDVPQGERLAFFASSGHLTIAVNKGVEGVGGGASGLLGLHVNDPIRVELVLSTRPVAVPA